MKKLFAAFMLILLITGCSGGGSYTDVSVDEAKELIDSGEAQVLDVRTLMNLQQDIFQEQN
ncbi:hypothetical protein [Mesobacillus boroniphilus]|uniref:Rhodanese-like domain protein n=1 Tax=Mesobacillus boroniphilus JCM 21738 TaxID=1294265 RepID=W4RLE9_9BACI|nr:hypothetical protein [Mesobacillus boroniphilus]GAE45265.1 hypothetical protein JCM21738_2046 [Mesobacillus boroniphilus JCM 21738]